MQCLRSALCGSLPLRQMPSPRATNTPHRVAIARQSGQRLAIDITDVDVVEAVRPVASSVVTTILDHACGTYCVRAGRLTVPDCDCVIGRMCGIMLVFRWYITHSEPVSVMTTSTSVNISDSMFQPPSDLAFMCRK